MVQNYVITLISQNYYSCFLLLNIKLAMGYNHAVMILKF